MIFFHVDEIADPTSKDIVGSKLEKVRVPLIIQKFVVNLLLLRHGVATRI